jgi:predicted O-methyltransferase YrrM
MIQPPYGRKDFFDLILKLMDERSSQEHNIVEIGMTRIVDNWSGDGYSTPLFAWYINAYGGRLTSVDILPQAITSCANIIKTYEIPTNNIFLINGDGLTFFDHFNLSIDLLYLDAWDWKGSDFDKKISEQSHLICFKKAERMLKSGGYVMIDDIFNIDSWEGKGKQLIPYLLENNYEKIAVGYVCIFKKP